MTRIDKNAGGAAVTVRGLVKHYGETKALDGVDLDVREGTVMGVLGPNGAGKTTLVRILSTLLAPDTGRATVAGYDVVRQPRQLRRVIGLTGQYASVDEKLSGWENLYMIGRLLDVSRKEARRRADELLERFSLTEAAKRPAATYSGGMRRRLDLAASMIGAPAVLFLDEPTTGLDAEGRRDTWELVSALRDGGTTVLLTTHYLEEAENLADRLAIMHEGRIATTGTPAEVTAAEPSRISFELPEGYFVGDLPPLGELGVTGHGTDGRIIRLRTHELQRTATGLLTWAAQARVELRRLDVRSASLEEAFLGIAKNVSAEQAMGMTTKEYAA